MRYDQIINRHEIQPDSYIIGDRNNNDVSYIYINLFRLSIMAHILICHTDSIIVRGLEAFLSSSGKYQIYVANNYLNCLKSASFLQELGETFVLIAEGKILDSDKCRQLAEFDRAKLILCDRKANHNSLLLALNCNSSYISLEHNEPHNLALAVQCAFVYALPISL